MDIKRSTKPMTFQLIGISISGIILMIFTTSVFNAIDNIMPWDWSGLTRFARLIVFGAIVIGLILAWLNAKKERYSLNNNALIIHKGGMGRNNEDIYSLKNITSLSVRQPFLGSRNGYGYIHINMDKLEQNSQIVLSNVINPQDVARQINTAKANA